MKERSINAVWSKEAAEDLKGMGYYAIDAEKELTELLQKELQAEMLRSLTTWTEAQEALLPEKTKQMRKLFAELEEKERVVGLDVEVVDRDAFPPVLRPVSAINGTWSHDK